MSTAAPVWISAERIAAELILSDMVEPVADALRAYSRGDATSTALGLLRLAEEGEAHVKTGLWPGRGLLVVKVATMCPSNRRLGRPVADGCVVAIDAATGRPLAFLHDAKRLTDLRTAAVSVLATRMLARTDASTVGVLGSGGQAVLQAQAVADVRPISRVLVWARDPQRAAAAAAAIRAALLLEVQTLDNVRAVTEQSDVLACATASTQPLVRADWLQPGIHINAIGADDEEKVELESACFGRARHIVVDSRDLACRLRLPRACTPRGSRDS